MIKGVLAVESDIDGHRLGAQDGRDRHRQLGVVLSKQNSH
jgi:hypothetical protein